ncbi:MAG: DEAD/DEAH box helicase, partial [Acidobacteriota bacterium]
RWAEEEARRAERRIARERFLADVEAGKRSLDVLKHRLYPYQEEGALHLAFTERALLGDEMGLGKTVQAIAACELLRRLRGIERVLVICPVSLKAEWEEQIAKFTDLPALTVLGRRPERLRRYRERSFFYLVNYEQVLADGEDIQRLLAPDVIVLDEAQRIKNWRTKTAQAVKRLESRYAFVLTGTPLENRIDDLYSIVQLLDPRIFGPLFRFNRDFHELDERGRPVGYKNLSEMHRRLRPVVLRRRKADVEDQLPERTVNTYFVAMHEEQQVRYEEFELRVAKLAAMAKRRPLTAKEFEKLQRDLACMRMVCDTPYILDEDCRVCPKLGELESVLEELLDEDGQKVLVFSEWERMLRLVRELAEEMGVAYAWHTGSVPQDRRRGEVRRFKDDPECRLFLSTDSGGLGLNLQAASAVVNLDLPWNPARLEQRIARAWRKHQKRAVQVIHLVTEGSIEHRMLGLLAGKQVLAEGVLDGRDGVDVMPLPSGRAVFLERLEELLDERLAKASRARDGEGKDARGEEAPDLPPAERLRQDVTAVLGERLLLLDLVPPGEDRPETVLAVVDRLDGPSGEVRAEVEAAVHRAYGQKTGGPRLELLDRAAYETVLRLADAGVVSLPAAHPGAGGRGDGEPLFRSAALGQRQDEARRRRLAEARELLAEGERKLWMATLLGEHGFGAEAAPPLAEALERGLRAVARLAGIKAGSGAGSGTGPETGARTEEVPAAELGPRLEPQYGKPPAEAARLLALLQAVAADEALQAASEEETPEWLERGTAHFRALEEILERAALQG